MINFDKNEFLKPQIYSTLDEYETRCNVTKEIIKEIDELQQENQQLKINWNKLKVYIKTEIPEDVFIDTEWFVSILDKMQKLEQGSDSNGNN